MDEIRFGEVKERVTIDENGDEKLEEVVVGIPQCCREGWASCPHVLSTVKQRIKKNIAI